MNLNRAKSVLPAVADLLALVASGFTFMLFRLFEPSPFQ
jgi:hypothetical protein